jgi:apolipoprotein D and lipocalin family protein
MKHRHLLLACLLPLFLCGCRASGALPGAGELTSVEGFALERYLGSWYEISKYPVSFEQGLVGVRAEYSLRDDGDVRVLNSGRRGDFDGELDTAEGHAWIPDPEHPERLKVSFFWPFRADYWVIALDPDYRWAVVGEPKRRYLWVLSRTPALPQATYAGIVARIEQLGYDTARLERMPQPD